MGEGTTRIGTGNGAARDADLDKQTRALETEIESLRTRLDRSLAELDRRRHEYMDVRLQLRKHPGILIGAGVAGVLLLGGIAFSIYRARTREQPMHKVRRFRLAVGRAVDNTRRATKRQPSVGEKILAAVGTTLAVSLTKKAIERAWTSPRTV